MDRLVVVRPISSMPLVCVPSRFIRSACYISVPVCSRCSIPMLCCRIRRMISSISIRPSTCWIVDDIQSGLRQRRLKIHSSISSIIFFRNGKRIILASDRPPVDLKGMNDRLFTRFCGLIAELEKPNVELCVDILNNKIRRDGLKIPADVVRFIAETANGSVRR